MDARKKNKKTLKHIIVGCCFICYSFVLLVILIHVFVACASVKDLPQENSDTTATESTENAHKSSKKEDSLLIEQTLQTTEIDYVAEYENTCNNLSINVIAPKETIVGKDFGSPYEISVKDSSSKAINALDICVVYPISRNNDDITYATNIITTDIAGNAQFIPPTPAVSMQTQISFYPAPNKEVTLDKIKLIIEKYSVNASYKVHTSMLQKGGAISIVDYDKNGKAITTNSKSSSALLMAMMNCGFKGVGNADFTQQIINDRVNLYTTAHNMLQGNATYLIFGTVRYIKSPTTVETGLEAGIVADISVMNMNDGSIFYHTQKQYTGTAKNETALIDDLRKKMGQDIAQTLYYAM